MDSNTGRPEDDIAWTRVREEGVAHALSKLSKSDEGIEVLLDVSKSRGALLAVD